VGELEPGSSHVPSPVGGSTIPQGHRSQPLLGEGMGAQQLLSDDKWDREQFLTLPRVSGHPLPQSLVRFRISPLFILSCALQPTEALPLDL
jgi:hypothetical protein